MANLARAGALNNRVRNYAERCVDWLGVDLWLRQTYRYRDEDEEVLRSPEFMIHDLETQGYSEGDCDDVATLAAACGKVLGYPTRLTALQTKSPSEFDHVFCEVDTGNGWGIIDPTVRQGTTYNSFGMLSEYV